MTEQLTRSMACPGCGKAATVVLNVEPADADGIQRLSIESYSCPENDFAPEALVLRALGYA